MCIVHCVPAVLWPSCSTKPLGHDPVKVVAFVSALLTILLNIEEALQQAVGLHIVPPKDPESVGTINSCHGTLQALSLATASSLNCYRLLNSHNLYSEDFGFWIKPQSTAWFTRFVMDQFDDDRWVQHFRLTKGAVVMLSKMLAPHIRRQNTKYRLAIQRGFH